MNRAVRAELEKLRTTRLPWILLAGCQVLVLMGVAGLIGSGEDVHLAATATKALAHVGLVSLFSLLLGITAEAGEHRHGTIVDTYVVEPRRGRVLAAKLVVYVGAGLALALASSVTAVLATAIAFSAKGGTLDLGAATTWRTLGGAVVWNVAFAAMGVAIGALARNLAGAIAGALAWIALVEGVLGQLVGRTAGKWLPFAAGLATGRANTGSTAAPQWAAATALVAYAAVLVVAARSLTLGRDVT